MALSVTAMTASTGTLAISLVAAIAIAVGLGLALWERTAAVRRIRVLHEESRKRLAVALDGADCALWDWNVVENRTDYSDRWSQMLGYLPQEIGDSVEIWERLVHREDLPAAMGKLQELLAGRSEAYQAEFRMKAKSGTWVWIQARGKVVARARDGSPARVAGTHIDITATKRTEAALARDSALLRTLIESVPDCIFAKDLEGRFLFVNTALGHMLGVTPEEAVGKTDFDFYSAHMAGRFRADDLQVFASGEPIVAREEPGNSDTPLWMLTTKVPIRDEAGKVVGLVGLSRDITDVRRREADRRTGAAVT